MGIFDEKQQQRKRLEDEMFDISFRELAGVVTGKKRSGASENVRLRMLDVMQELSRGLNITIPYSANAESDASWYQEQYFRPRGIMWRAVSLRGKWYEDAINWAASHGIVAGYTDGRFGVNDPVKRQDLVAIMYKYAAYKGYDTALNGDISKFADKATISTYAENGMKWGVGHSIISGIKDGNNVNAQPKASANRAQLAVILKAFDQNVKK